MKQSLKATSIIEAIMVTLIVTIGFTGLYQIVNSSMKFSESTRNRIEAIQISRDGIEAFTNIRDTNWLLYPADYTNCWNTLNYSASCIANTGTGSDIWHANDQAFIVYQDENGRFSVSPKSLNSTSSGSYNNQNYRGRFQIMKDANGFYTQSGGTLYGANSLPHFTRHIELDYIDNSGNSQGPTQSNHQRVQVNSIVQWRDSIKSEPQKIEMSVILTNWKAQKN